MLLTAVLSLAGCIAFFLMILGVTVTLPSPMLISFFPEDVQERLRPRVENQPMTFKRAMGWVMLAAFCLFYIGIVVYGASDGIKNGYSFWQFLLRFLIIGAAMKVFDIVFFDWFILTRTRFFSALFPRDGRMQRMERIWLQPQTADKAVHCYPGMLPDLCIHMYIIVR